MKRVFEEESIKMSSTTKKIEMCNIKGCHHFSTAERFENRCNFFYSTNECKEFLQSKVKRLERKIRLLEKTHMGGLLK